jgi:rhodanese-related sulfurtransferase
VLLDVREPYEWRIAHIEGAQLVPLRTLPGRVQDFDRGSSIVLYCHMGVRSLQALDVMRQAGFENVSHLKGGIDAWSAEVDPSVVRY